MFSDSIYLFFSFLFTKKKKNLQLYFSQLCLVSRNRKESAFECIGIKWAFIQKAGSIVWFSYLVWEHSLPFMPKRWNAHSQIIGQECSSPGYKSLQPKDSNTKDLDLGSQHPRCQIPNPRPWTSNPDPQTLDLTLRIP